METGPPADPLARLRIPASGGGQGSRAGRPRQARGGGRPQCLGVGGWRHLPTPDGAHLLRGVREAGGTRDTPLDSLSSESRLSPTASTPAPGSYSLGARGVTGLRPVWCARPQRWVFASYEADTVKPIFQVKALRIMEGKARGRAEQEPGRLLRAAPWTARGSSGLSDTPASLLQDAWNEGL